LRNQYLFEESILKGLSVTHTTGVGDTILAMVLGREVYKNIEMSLGPTFIFPTATDKVLGQGKWQAGPAALIFYNSKKMDGRSHTSDLVVVCRR